MGLASSLVKAILGGSSLSLLCSNYPYCEISLQVPRGSTRMMQVPAAEGVTGERKSSGLSVTSSSWTVYRP